MELLLEIIKKLKEIGFTGSIIIRFNQGGVRTIREIKEEIIKLDD